MNTPLHALVLPVTNEGLADYPPSKGPGGYLGWSNNDYWSAKDNGVQPGEEALARSGRPFGH